MGGGGAEAPPPPVLVIGGFLGSGKTSLILDFARWFTAAGGRLGVLVNEAGNVGIDGSVLSAPGHRVREVFGGCVCCSLAGDLEMGVRALAACDIDLVVLEPSGMAEVDRIAALLEDHAGSAVVVAAVIDAPRLSLLRRAAGGLLESSLRAARYVLINKVDAAEDSALEEARAWVRGLRPDAEILEVSAEQGVASAVWERLARAVVPGWGGTQPDLSAVVPFPARPDRDAEEVASASTRVVMPYPADPAGIRRVVEVLLRNAVAGLGDEAAGHAKVLARWPGGGLRASTTGAGARVVVSELSPDDGPLGSPEGIPGVADVVVDLVLLFAGRTEAELTAAIEDGLSAVRADPAV